MRFQLHFVISMRNDGRECRINIFLESHFIIHFLLGRSADKLWIAFPRAGPLHELSYGFQDARAVSGSFIGYTGQIAETDERARRGLQSHVQLNEIFQS